MKSPQSLIQNSECEVRHKYQVVFILKVEVIPITKISPFQNATFQKASESHNTLAPDFSETTRTPHLELFDLQRARSAPRDVA